MDTLFGPPVLTSTEPSSPAMDAEIAALEWLSDNDQDFADAEDRLAEIELHECPDDGVEKVMLMEALDEAKKHHLAGAPCDWSVKAWVARELRAIKAILVNVEEAATTLGVIGKEIGTFDYVAYGVECDNWLILCAEPTDSTRKQMQEWQDIFGDGFKAVFATKGKSHRPAYQVLSGERVSIEAVRNHP